MKEDFVCYVWKYHLVHGKTLFTTDGKPLEILFPGHENRDAGPDFLAARIRLDGTVWAGNVEVHVLSSYWYVHGHHHDKSYDNIILHVVFHCDREAVKANGSPIPHLVINSYCDPRLKDTYKMLMLNKKNIPCEKLIQQVDHSTFRLWLYRLLVCRLERKAGDTTRFLDYFQNNWEQLCIYMVARYLGGRANASTFGLLIQRTPFMVMMKNHDNLFALEALFFGQAGLLERSFRESYPSQLKREYEYLCKKYDLPERIQQQLWKYSRMRPAGFPDVRISQLAALIYRNQGKLFQKMLYLRDKQNLYDLLRVELSPYWRKHYRLDTETPKTIKRIGTDSADNILINVMAPLFFVYAKERNKRHFVDVALDLVSATAAEDNRITKIWKDLGRFPENAGESQGMIELYKNYCLPGKCLKCAAGHQVLKRSIK